MVARWRPARRGVELLNVLRPTVATAVYITFLAHALDTHPAWRERLTDSSSEDLAFVEEVRRFYPFFPAVAAIVREQFEWRGHRFPQGRRVLLDLYGTNHDGRCWPNPNGSIRNGSSAKNPIGLPSCPRAEASPPCITQVPW